MKLRCRLLGHGMAPKSKDEMVGEFHRTGRIHPVKCPACGINIDTPVGGGWPGAKIVLALVTGIILGTLIASIARVLA